MSRLVGNPKKRGQNKKSSLIICVKSPYLQQKLIGFTSPKVFHGEQSPEYPSLKNQTSQLKTHNTFQKRVIVQQ
jgi:hypothetical protein